jgi:hypothetical protein
MVNFYLKTDKIFNKEIKIKINLKLKYTNLKNIKDGK